MQLVAGHPLDAAGPQQRSAQADLGQRPVEGGGVAAVVQLLDEHHVEAEPGETLSPAHAHPLAAAVGVLVGQRTGHDHRGGSH